MTNIGKLIASASVDVNKSVKMGRYTGRMLPVIVSNQRNPAARHCTGMSAAAERGMVTRIMRLYEGYGDLYIPRISGS